MKIIYEIGDTVEIEDNFNAGDTAASVVELLKEISPKRWRVKIIEGWGPEYGTIHIVDEIWFSPG